jgi:hypothetical protein
MELLQDFLLVVICEFCMSYEHFLWQDNDVLIVLCPGVYPWWSGQHVRCGVDLSWDVFYDEVIVLQRGEPSCHSAVDVLGVFPVQQVGVIGEDGDGLFHGCQVWLPIFQSFDHHQ